MTKNQRLQALALRRSGDVQRCHTTPHHGIYTVAQHVYGMMSLLLSLHPNPSMMLIKAVMWHDASEKITGDMPGHTKARNESLRREWSMLDREVEELFGIDDIDLTFEDNQWLKALDVLDLYLWGRDQQMKGNQFVDWLVNCQLEKLYECDIDVVFELIGGMDNRDLMEPLEREFNGHA